MVDHADDGMPVYSVDGADRAIFHDERVVLKMVGGDDGPFGVSMTEEGALQTALQILAAPKGRMTGFGVQLGGITLGREGQTGRMIMTLKFEGGGDLHVAFNADQERQIYETPRLPPLVPPRAN